jgi:hypothetical protein
MAPIYIEFCLGLILPEYSILPATYMFNSTELMMSIDRGLYELRTGNNINTAALLVVL